MPSREMRTRAQSLTPKQKDEFREIIKQLTKQAKQLELRIRDLKDKGNRANFRIY
jgi:hypothetical protein